ncbi:MAG: hypothetical protein JWN56_1232 [Sphingobacteriales bacterium]|nr:hypothetical protein [Sphingobacteriales bacterium]
MVKGNINIAIRRVPSSVVDFTQEMVPGRRYTNSAESLKKETLRGKNGSNFETLYASTDAYFLSVNSVSDTTALYNQPFNRTKDSKLFVQRTMGQNTYYRLFDINPDKSNNVIVDLLKVNIKASKNKIQLPNSTQSVYYMLSGKLSNDPYWYSLGQSYTETGDLEIPVPNNCFNKYNCSVNVTLPFNSIEKGTWGYSNLYPFIPTKFDPLEMRMDALNYDKESFRMNATGKFDNFDAMFFNLKGTFAIIYLHSIAKNEDLKIPDLAAALEMPQLKMEDFNLISIVFTKHNKNGYKPWYAGGNLQPEDEGWQSASFSPEWNQNFKTISAANIQRKLQAASSLSNMTSRFATEKMLLNNFQLKK